VFLTVFASSLVQGVGTGSIAYTAIFYLSLTSLATVIRFGKPYQALAALGWPQAQKLPLARLCEGDLE
jgi:hypothetical protein